MVIRAYLRKIYDKVVSLYPVKFKGNLDRIDYALINRVFDKEFEKRRDLVDEILKYDKDDVDFIADEERAFPANKEFYENGYYKMMFKRYLFTGSFFCNNKTVLDSCSGLGWGSYILAHYANKVVSFDIDPQSVSWARATWKHSNIQWLTGDALTFDNEETFDVVTCMETIEHFTVEQTGIYLGQMKNRLKKGGILIGTSHFPLTQLEAETLKSKNQYHPCVLTMDEIKLLLSENFSQYKIIKKWMFIAIK